MASVPVVQATTKFSDAAGKTQLVKYNVAYSLTGGVLDVSAMNTASGAIVDAVEAMSKLKLEGSQITIPLAINTGAFKADAVAGSTVREQGYINFLSAPGVSLRHTSAKIFIPSPKNSALAQGGTRVLKTATDVATLITAVKANAFSTDGRALQTDTNTGVRQVT